MIKSLLQRLFGSEERQNDIKNDVQNNLVIKTTKEAKEHITDSALSNAILEKGKVQSIVLPELGDQKELILKKWHVKPGDVIKSGDIVCEIENKKITLEFESIYSGKVIAICPLHQELTTGVEIFKVEGI